jgi:hypothetical protein
VPSSFFTSFVIDLIKRIKSYSLLDLLFLFLMKILFSTLDEYFD